MAKHDRPKPPPADGEPHADEHGEATDYTARQVSSDGQSGIDAIAATSPAGKVIPGVDGETPGALITDATGIFVARPDPTKPLGETVVCIGNWYGSYDGKPAHVKHGTPLSELPSALVDAITNTRGQRVGPLPPKEPPNALAP
jgi:hypothetical protein